MISTHILDTSKGNPAEGVRVTLDYRQDNSKEWTQLEVGQTNSDGRFKFEQGKEPGQYRITFAVEEYVQDSFFLNTHVGFNIKDTGRNYHVPLLLNPYGYSTYRGS